MYFKYENIFKNFTHIIWTIHEEKKDFQMFKFEMDTNTIFLNFVM
jgi:hypothetical protein